MTSRTGFTLIDTLVAVLVLEVALLGLAGVLSSGERLLARGRLATRAAVRGRDLLARVARSDSVCAADVRQPGLQRCPGYVGAGRVARRCAASPC